MFLFTKMKKIKLCIVVILQSSLFYTIFGKPNEDEYKACTKPLGMESGAIPDSFIDCTPSHWTQNECAATCHKARYGVTYGPSYWCRKDPYGFFKVSFIDLTVIAGFVVESKIHEKCKIDKLYIRHGYNNDSISDYTGQGTERIIFEMDTDEMHIWLDKPIIAREIVIVPTQHTACTFFRARFEFYGCVFADFSFPLGMESGKITDQQISLEPISSSINYFNPHAARLNTAMEGWKGSFGNENNLPDVPKAWLLIDLGKTFKVLSITVQQATTADLQNSAFFIKYGFPMKSYTGIEKNDISEKPMIISPPQTDTAYKDTKYNFNYPLIAQYIEYYPYNDNAQYPFVKLEFYGIPSYTASHHWPLHSNSLEDEIAFQNFVPSVDQLLENDGLSITGLLSSQVRTLPFRADDCIVNAENCGSGLTVSFSAKVNEIPQGLQKTFAVSISSANHSQQCYSTGLNTKEIFAVHMSNIKLAGSSLLNAVLEIPNMSPLPTNIYLIAEVFVDKTTAFTTSCNYADSHGENSRQVTMDRSTSTYKVDVQMLLLPVTSITSLTIVLTPITTQIIDMNIPSDVVLKTFENLDCASSLTYGVVSSLDDNQFSQSSDACTNPLYAAANAKMTTDGAWGDCGAGYLEINLGHVRHISMVKVSGYAGNFVKKFKMKYSLDKINWETIYKYDDQSEEFIFKKTLSGNEYLPLPVHMHAQHVRIYPIVTQGQHTLMQIEFGECVNEEEIQTASAGNRDSVLINRDGTQCHFVWVPGNGRLYQYINTVGNLNTQSIYNSEYIYHIGTSQPFKLDVDSSLAYLYYGKINVAGSTIMGAFNDVIDFELTATDVFFVRSTNIVYRKSRATVTNALPDETFTSAVLIDKVAVNPSADTLYGLSVAHSNIYELSLSSANNWQLFSERNCSMIRISGDGTLFCLWNNDVFEWDAWLGGWKLGLHTTACDTFDASNTHIICLDVDNILTAVKRNGKDVLSVIKIALYVNGITKINLRRDTANIYAWNSNDRCLMIHDFSTGWKSQFCNGGCEALIQHTNNYYACIKPDGYTWMSDQTSYIFRWDNKPSRGAYYWNGYFYFVDDATDSLVRYHRYTSSAHIYQTYNDSSNVVSDGTHLWHLKSDKNIYQHNALLCVGPCDAFKRVSSILYCLRDGHVYKSSGCIWSLIFDEMQCDSFDIKVNDVLCWVIGGGLYKKKIVDDTHTTVSPKFPIISSGLQRFKDVSIGTGFQVALSSSQSSLVVSVQTETTLAEATFNIVIENGLKHWNDYRFVWIKESNTLSLYVNGALVDTQSGHLHQPETSTQANNFINVGGFYDHLVSFSQNFKLRDLRIWKQFLNDADFFKSMAISDTITFDHMNSGSDYEITGTCSRYPYSTAPCADEELSSILEPGPVYFYSSGIVKYFEGLNLCAMQGGKSVSVHGIDQMSKIYNLPSPPITSVYLPYHKSTKWEDNTPFDYSRFFQPNSVCDCIYYLANYAVHDMKWFCVDCNQMYHRVCEIDGHLLGKTYSPSMIQYGNDTQCFVVPYSPGDEHDLVTSHDLSRKYTIILYNLDGFPEASLISKAHVVYVGKGTSSGINFNVNIGVLNHTDPYCVDSENIENYIGYVKPVVWEMDAHSPNKKVISPDISTLLKYHRGIMPKGNSSTLPIIIYWDNAQGPNERKCDELSLAIFYYSREGNNFLLFSSESLETKYPPAKFVTSSFSNQYQSLSFWYHMSGSEVGTLYVWFIDAESNVDPYLAFVVQGDKGDGWKQAVVVTPIMGVHWTLEFLVYKRSNMAHDVAIDTIEGSITVANPTYVPLYSMTGDSLYLSYLKQYGLPQPKMLFPFKKSYDGHAVYNKALSGHDTSSFSWTNDKFLFPYHALNVTRAANVLLQVEDILDVAAVVTSEFTIAFNLKFQLLDTSITFCQFGNSGSGIIQINIDDDKLVIKHGSTDVYESSWRFVSNTWTYVGIMYKTNKLEVYYNNTVDDVKSDFSLTDTKPFPTSLHLLRDPSKLGAGDMFEGLISCFQFYNESMSPTQLQALEFCPDRFEPVLCPKTCHSSGHCSPLKANCDCPPTLQRYYNTKNCLNTASGLRENALLSLNFDLPNDNQDLTYMEASPINYGLCINTSSAVLANISSNCVLTLNSCELGLLLSFWMYIEEDQNIGDLIFFQLGNLRIGANFTFDTMNPSAITGEMTWKSDVSFCKINFPLPLKAWVYLTVWVIESTISWDINYSESSGSASCNSHSEEMFTSIPLLSIGNVSRLCVDEIAVYPYSRNRRIYLLYFYNIITTLDKEPRLLLRVKTNMNSTAPDLRQQLKRHADTLQTFSHLYYEVYLSRASNIALFMSAHLIVHGKVTDKMREEFDTTTSIFDVGGIQYTIYGSPHSTHRSEYWKMQDVKRSDNYFAALELSITCWTMLWKIQLSDHESMEYISLNERFSEALKRHADTLQTFSHLYYEVYLSRASNIALFMSAHLIVHGKVTDKMREEFDTTTSIFDVGGIQYTIYGSPHSTHRSEYWKMQDVKRSDNYFAALELSITCWTMLWKIQLSDHESMEYISLNERFSEAVQRFMEDRVLLLSSEYEYGKFEFWASNNGTVRGYVKVTIKLYFEVEYADRMIGIYKNTSAPGFTYEIERTNKSFGLPYPVIEYTAALVSDTEIQINISNSEILDKRYHKGYLVSASTHFVLTGDYHSSLEKVFHTGVISFLFSGITIYRMYHITVYPLTHQGFGPSSNVTLIGTPPSVNLIGPNFHNAQAQSATELMLQWDDLPQNDWNSPHLFSYGVLYKNAFDIDADNLSTYEFANISSSTTSYLLSNLSVFTMYNLYLGTTNDIGFGGLSLKTVRTGPGPPEMAPNMMSIEIIDTVYVKFEWMPIPDDIEIYNGNNLSKYEIEIQALHPSLVSAECQTILNSVSSMVHSFQLEIGCRPWQSFKVYIAANNTEGFGGVTNEYCYTLGRYVPGRISVLNATTSDPMADGISSINITMGKVPIEHENTIVTYYEVRYKSIDWADAWKVVNISIGHSHEYKTLIKNSRTYYMNCSRMGNNMASNDTIIPSSIIVHKTLPVYYYTNYEVKGRACSDEGCSMLNMTTQIRTAEHSPFCPPANISIFNTSSTSMKVTFEQMSHQCLSGQLQFYGILFFETEKFAQYEGLTTEELKQTNVYNETTELEVTYFNLNEYWNYTVIVFAENNGGAGVLSAPVSALTAEAAPDGPPLKCTIHNGNSTSIVLSIGKPDRLLMNGLIHYKIVIINGFGDVITREVELAGEMTTTVFSNLTKFMFHNISIRAVTTVGEGPEALIYNRTLEDVPSLPPTDVAVSNVTENFISLVWNDIPALSVHGILQTYNITGCGLLRNKTWDCFHRDAVDKEVTFSVFPGTTYHFEIAGCTNVGCGPTSGLVQSSLEMVPSGTVNNISAAWITSNSINISWMAVSPMERRGNVTYYNVSMINIPHNWQSPQLDVSERFLISFETFMNHSITYILFENLNNYTTYRFNLTAYTEVGPGPTSKEIEYTTEQNIPSMAPENVTAFDTSSSSLNVSWIPLHPSHHEGILLGYNISYNVSDGFTDIRGGYTQGYHVCEGGDRTSCEVTGLSLNTPFDIHVVGFTIRGLGPWSVKINATTGMFVDGNWTSWTEWGSCSRSCGIGRLMRQRWCINPKPQLGGNNCTGSSKNYCACNNITCPGYYLAAPEDSCTKACQSLGAEFDCTIDMNFQNITSPFTTAIDIFNYSQFVNIACNTSEESSFYDMSSHPSYNINTGLCQGYKKIPFRTDCNANADSLTRRLCRCLDKESAQYTEWANWGMCSKTCGTGKYQRFRECIMANGCTGSDVALTDCNTHPCPINGLWSQWSPFSNCTKSCGFGSKIRTRTCTDPAPEHNGKDCEGDVDTEAIEGCNPLPCPVHGQWGQWQSISECKFSCGSQGFKIQMRYCDDPAPMYDGAGCVGNNSKRYECEENKPCYSAKYMFKVRFIDEVWNFPMYNLDNELSKNFSKRIENEVKRFYNDSTLSELADEIVIEFHEMSKGSVIVQFSIEFAGVPYIESLILQHAIEGGHLNDMPTGLNSISVPTLPNGPPATVQAESTTPFTIDVKWSRLNASIINGNLSLYQVFFKKLEGDNIENEQWDNFGTTDLNYTLRDLTPGVLYGIRVLASNDHGNGVASALLKIRTIEGVPYIKPPECNHQSLDERTVYFSWDEIPAHQVPGVLRGYEIKYRKYKETNYMYERTDETLLQKTVSNFKPFTWYWVEVAGFTNAGVGPHEVFVFQTPPGAPEIAPPNATAHSHSSTEEMLVTWDFIPKDDENGYLAGYKLYYRKYRQGGVDTFDEDFVVAVLDRFTNSYRMNGLESYTQYEITIYGYSAFGDGPSAVIYGETCKCPKYIFNNWYEKKPYTIQIGPTSDVVEGLFPDLISMVLNAVCIDCNSYLPTMYYNKTRDGRAAKKQNVEQVKKYVDDNVHMSFPIFGRFALTRFAGVHPFVGIIQSQGSAMLVYQPEYNTVGFAAILGAVAGAWPVILIAVLLAYMAGCVFWFLEQSADECDLTQNRALYGSLEGFWMSFITMTTLGYGDYVPYANVTKGAMIFWILMGLCIVSIFGGAVSSGMSVGALSTEYKLYGATVAAVKNSFEYRTAILRNAEVDPQVNYSSIVDVINAVANRSVQIGFVDAISTQGYEKELVSKHVKIYKILHLDSGLGVVLSGEFARVENDMRSFVTSNQAKISSFVEKKIGILQPEILDVEELLLTPEESISLLTTLLIIYVIMALVGIIAWLLLVVRPRCRKISPQEQMDKKRNDLCALNEVFAQFTNGFAEKVQQLDEKHSNERVELNDLKRSYRMHVKRGDVPELQEPERKNVKRRRRRKIEKSTT